MTDEAKLIAEAAAGDETAFEAIVRANEGYVYRLALRMLNSPEDAEDVTQEVFVKAWRNLAGFRGECKLRVWLCRLTGNACIDLLRRRHEAVSLTGLGSGDEDSGDAELELPDTRPLPEQEAERNELRQAVRGAMDQLGEPYRTVLMLREVGEASYDEIGRTLNLDPGTVKSRLFRARKKLCAILTAPGNILAPAASIEQEGGERHDGM